MSTTNSESAVNPSTPVTSGPVLDRVRPVVEPIVVAHGVELFDIEWLGTHHGRILRVTIDRVGELDGDIVSHGVTVDDCVRVSRDLSTALDVEEVVPEHYSLEVSSPGLDRPLITVQDFSRQVGKLAKVRLLSPSHDGQRVLRGQIVSVSETDVTMNIDGNEHVFGPDAVEHARLVFEIGTGPKKQGGGPKKTWAPKKTKGGAKRQNRKKKSSRSSG